jgi:hypothetical protein
MVVFSKLVQLSMVAAAIACTIPAEFRSLMRRTTVLGYDEIVGLAQAVPDTTVGTLYTAYQPYLKIVNGCVPFPAVDAAGDVRYFYQQSLLFRSKLMKSLAEA